MNDLERSIGDIIFLPLILAERILNDILGIDSKDSLFSIKAELQSCGEQLQKAWAVFNDNKEVMLGSDKAKAYESLTEARQKLDAAWAEWKNASQRIYDAQQKAWQDKRQQFVERVEANIEKLEDKLTNARSALAKQESHLDDLREKLESAWNENFRERCASWIEECETRIQDINSHIDRMEGWLQEERSKLK